MFLSCCILILLLLILLLVLSLSLIRCCCAFFSICHFTLTYNLLILICHIIFLFPLSVPDMKNLLPSNVNLSHMLEFDDSLFLFSEVMNLTTRIFLLSSWLVHVKLLSLTFEILNGSLVKFVN